MAEFPVGVFCVFHTESDGYTYSSESLLGVYATHDDAETALLIHIEEITAANKRIAELDVLWRAGFGDVHEELKTLRDDNRPLDSTIENYEIRQVATGAPLQLC